MSNKSKAKGTRAETKVVRYLQSQGIQAERRALHGSNDVGDILINQGVVKLILEVKAGKQTTNPNRTQITEWLRQTKDESENSSYPGALTIVRYHRSLEDAEVYLIEPNGIRFMYLDELAMKLKV